MVMAPKKVQTQKNDVLPTMHLRLWLGTDEGVLFGPGRAELLELIDRFGSLRKAAFELGISYRAAWGKIRKTERILGYKIVDKGESYKEGYHLTAEGRVLKDQFAKWHADIQRSAIEKARAIFGWSNIKEEEGAPKPPPRQACKNPRSL
jgi:molybdate transport system regulatory protein